MKEIKKQGMFYVNVPEAGEYGPFTTKETRMKVINQHLKELGKKPL